MCDIKKLVAQDSRNMAKLGNSIGWDWLEQEANQNIEDPSRAMRKAALAAATWYAGGALGGAAGAGAGTAAEAAAQAGTTAAEMTAEQMAAMAAQEMGPSMMGGLMSAGEQVPQGFANTMEAGLMDTGYTPSSLLQAFKNTGETTPLGQNLQNYGKQMVSNAQNGGLLNQANMGDPKQRMMMNMGQNMMNPQQPQMMPMQPPPRQNEQMPEMKAPYQDSPYGPGGNSLGLTEEQKRKLRAMGYPV